MERLTFKINDVDYTSAIQRYGMATTYQKREGNNGGMMLDGSMTVDVIAYKAVLTIPLNPMLADEQAALISTVATDYVDVYYFDAKTGGYRTAMFIPDIGMTSAVIMKSDGNKYFSGLALTLTER